MAKDRDRLHADLARYYDQEASARAARLLSPERLARRAAFIEQLRAEGRERVLEVGTGPGVDAAALVAAGLDVAGVDLSPEHVALARAAGIDVQVAPAQSLPYPDASFDALWSMSVLMHMPDADLDAALAEFARVLRPGALAAFGTWGGDGTAGVNPDDELDPPRYFSWRTDEAMQAAVGRYARVEAFETSSVLTTGGRSLRYQWTLARFGDSSPR